MHVRAARPDDYDAWLGFWSYLEIAGTPPVRERWAEQLCPHTIFLEDAGELVAYNLAFAFGDRGDVRQVAVAPSARGRGVGKALMTAVAAKLRAAGCREWRLEVRATNEPALALYRSAGMTPHHDIHTVQMAIADCEKFAACRSGMHAVTAVVPADDAALEAALDLGRGQLARWRAYRASSPQMRVGTTAMMQVMRDFAPDFGLLFPFAAPDADVAAHLIAAALPGPAAYEIQLTQAPIHAALVAAGAVPREHLIEFAGAL
ncbi:MAG TPA: GNAT family N-acetyltransferase [Kofleriaceae bacterium]|nr:GNAT family N-acetyltransferase [Kofleriaceae bacterium]